MTEFRIRGGQFNLDGQPILIQAGEFHYFRTPQDQWRHRLKLLQAAGMNAVASYIPWLWHQPDERTTDLDGHTHPLRNLAGFLDLATEMGFWILSRPGPYINAETINEGIPPWVFARYPQVALISQDHQAQNLVSYLHPDFLACVRRWYQEVFAILAPRQVTHGGRILLIQLDNEMGMSHWVRNLLDIHPDTLQRFASYLRKSYGDQLNRRYQTQSLEEELKEGMINPKVAHATATVEDYRRFFRTYLREYASFLWEEAKKLGLKVPPVVNIHGFNNGGKTFPIGLSQLIEVIEMGGMITATDVYPGSIGEGNFHQLLMVNEITKALQNKEQALSSIEFQAGGNNDFSGSQSSLYDLHTRLCISSGMRLINHYLFCDGENDPILSPFKRHDWGHPVRKDGSLRRHYHRYPKLSRVLQAYGTDLVLAQTQVTTTIGFLLDHFMTEVNTPATQESTDILTHQREVILFDFIARGLALTHRPFRAVELSRSSLDPSTTPTLWVMIEQAPDAAVQQKLVEYAQAGGRLILIGRMCRGTSQKGGSILQDALGIEAIRSEPPFDYRTIEVFAYQDVPVSFVETYTGKFTEVIARQAEGEVVGFIQKLGAGKVLLLGAALATYTLEDLDIFRKIAEQMDTQPLFRLSDWADVRISEGEKGSFLTINNYQDDPVETRIEYHDQQLFGGNPIQLPARSGLILPLEWQVTPGVMIHYTTSEVTSISQTGDMLCLSLSQAEFTAEITTAGYILQGAAVTPTGQPHRYHIEGSDGMLRLLKR